MNITAFMLVLFGGSFGFASSSLSLLSMNVYMLPKPLKWSLQHERTQAIAEQLSNSSYDIVFFQEAFIDGFRSELAQKLKAQLPFSEYLNQQGKWNQIFGSGLFILSRHPLKVLDKVYFNQCEGFDCFASKGSQIVELTLPSGKKFQIANTHLQAGLKNGSIRLQQLATIKSSLNKVKDDRTPQLLVGDLNIDIADPEFAKGLAIMQMSYSSLSGPVRTTNARINDCYETPSRKLWIDHLWWDKKDIPLGAEIIVRDYQFNFDGKTCPLSDHHAVEFRQISEIVSK